MSSTTRAAQIASLSDQLRPLGAKARGMRLSADDWNAIVAAIAAMLKIDREQDEDVGTRLDQAYARADHQHVGQVSLAWLDPELQDILGSGGGTVSTRQAVAAMEQTVEGLRAEVGRLTALVERQQELIDRVLASDSDRTEQLRGFENRFAGLEDLRATVTALAREQGAIGRGVAQVVEFRSQLSPDGKPVDLAALAQRVTDLQQLRESLTGIDGKPLRLKDLQLEVRQLAGKAPAGAAGSVGAPGLEARLAALSNDLQSKASEEAEKRVDALRDEVRSTRSDIVAEVDTRLAEAVSTSRASALDAARDLVSAAETRLGTNLAGELTATRTALTATLRQQAGEAVAQGLAGVDARMGGLIESQAEGLRNRLAGELSEAVATRIDKAFADTAQSLDFRIADAESRVAAATQDIPQQLDERAGAIRSELHAEIENRVLNEAASLQLSLNNLVDQKVRTGLDAGLIEIRTVASESVSSALGNVDARIDSSVKSVTRGLLDSVTRTVDTRISEFNIPGQIASATSEVTSVLRSEIAVSAANVQKATSTALNSAIVGLKGELVAPSGAGTVLRGGGGVRFPGGNFPG